MSPLKGTVRWLLDSAFRIIPQSASGDLNLTPITSVVCNWCSVVCVVMAVWAHLFYSYHETRPAVTTEDPWVWHFLVLTAVLALGGLIYESCLAGSIKVMGLESVYQNDLLFRRRLRLNRKMLYTFSMLTTFYFLMAADLQYVHKGWLAEYHGGHQIVYSVRYVEWVMCAPMVLSISGQLDHAQDGQPRNGLIASSLLTGIYCIISWQGLVVTDLLAAWALIFWAFVCYFVASVEQLVFAWHIKDAGRAGPLRAGLIVYLVIMMGIYGVVYLLPIPGWLSATMENKFYCVGDASFKLGTSIMLVATNDLAANEELRSGAEAVAEELTHLISTASVPIFGVNTECRINEWNKKAAELTGLPKELALGRPLLDLMGEINKEDTKLMLRQALVGEETGHVEATLEVPTEPGVETKKATLVLSATPRRDKNNCIKGATFIGYDLTQVEAFKEAETRKTRFMAVVSHELRSPLHAISGLVDMLCDQEEDQNRLRLLHMVKDCASRLLTLVVNIMEMCSMVSKDGESHKKRLKREPVRLPGMIEEILLLVKSSKDKGGRPLVKPDVTLSSNVRDLPVIHGDPERIMQVFYNLITNACKFTSTGHIQVSSRVDTDRKFIQVMVADTGKGIARQALKRIFQPFEQEDDTENKHFQGVGLGLSIAHETVQVHGGHISVESEVGVGTTFTVELPLSEEEAAEPAGEPAEEPEEATEAPGKSRLRHWELPQVLSVDDDEVNQVLVRNMLKGEYEVVTVGDGQECLDHLANCDMLPDLVLMDLMMPGLSGFDTTRHIREEMKLSPSTLPVVMISASDVTTTAPEALRAGCNEYLAKPVNKETLKATLHLVHTTKFVREVGDWNMETRMRCSPQEQQASSDLRRRQTKKGP